MLSPVTRLGNRGRHGLPADLTRSGWDLESDVESEHRGSAQNAAQCGERAGEPGRVRTGLDEDDRDHRATGEPGTTASGLARIRQLLTGLCVPVTSTDVDGSGLSYDNARSAREFQALLRAARVSPWGSLLWNDLPVAGTMGAFIGRLDGPLTTGRVRAKGGSLAVARTLSGYATTLSTRPAAS